MGLKLNGQPVEVKKAYSDVFPLGRERTFTGFYADVSHLKPDTRYEVEVTLPDGLQPGQFQGLFFENVEAEFTARDRERQCQREAVAQSLAHPPAPAEVGWEGTQIADARERGMAPETLDIEPPTRASACAGR